MLTSLKLIPAAVSTDATQAPVLAFVNAEQAAALNLIHIRHRMIEYHMLALRALGFYR